MRRFFLMVLTMLLASQVSASGPTQLGLVESFYVNAGFTMVRMEGVVDNPDECQSTAFYALEPSQPGYEVLHSTLLTAYVSGKTVRFWVDGCGGQYGYYPHIKSVTVEEIQ